MAITRLSNSGIKTGVLKYDSALAGYPPVMAAPTAADGGTGTSATVSFSTISGATNYRAISTPGSFTGTSATSPITVSGLTTGVAYTFQIQAQNSVGYGGLSAASNSVTPVAAGSFDFITSVTATGGETQLAITGIPQTYQHLQLVHSIRRNANGLMQVYLRMNNVSTGSLYSYNYMYGNGNSVTGADSHFYDNIYIGDATSSNVGLGSGQFGNGIIDIFNYASTTQSKTIMCRAGYQALGDGVVNIGGGIYYQTTAVTSLQIYFQGDAVAAGSSIALYGIKGS